MYYSLFNLTFDSHFPLTNVPVVALPSAECISIHRTDKLELDIANMRQVGAYCWVNPTDFLLVVPDLAHFHVHTGTFIRVAVVEGADLGLLTAYLQGYMLAILLQQRGHLVLHGTVLQKNQRAIAICGASGSGKSTLAATLMLQDWVLVSDDLCVFDIDGGVLQGCDDLKIWPDVAEVLSLSDLKPFTLGLEKRQYCPAKLLSPANPPNMSSLPLSAIYCLKNLEGNDVTVSEFKGMRKFAPLKDNSYRTQFMSAMEHDVLFMRLCSEFLGQVPVFSVSRGNHKPSLDRLQSLSSLILDSLVESVA